MKGKKHEYLEWIRTQHFEHAAQEGVLVDYLKAFEDLRERVARLTKSLEELVESWSQTPLVKALQALRGVSVITATIIAAELGDLRGSRPPAADGVPRPGAVGTSSGEKRRRGASRAPATATCGASSPRRPGPTASGPP